MTPPCAWRTPLQRTFTSFPSGSVGAALLVLRLVVGTSAIAEAAFAAAAAQSSLRLAMVAFAVLAGLATLPGFLTSIAGALLAAAGAVMLLFMDMTALELLGSRMALFEFVVMASMLAVLGPGATSVDARLYGRREVATSNERGSEDL
jgi:putative oxidoreductase